MKKTTTIGTIDTDNGIGRIVYCDRIVVVVYADGRSEVLDECSDLGLETAYEVVCKMYNSDSQSVWNFKDFLA